MSDGRSWLGRLLAARQRPKPYRAETFRAREIYRADYELVAAHLLAAVPFASVFDVGCANGFLIQAFHRAERRIGGIDSSDAVLDVVAESLRSMVTVGDFTQATGRWDLVCCLEVAEHIEPERSRDLVETLARLAKAWIYFTAAPPGQTGRGHINCRPHDEWLAWFEESGWQVDRGATAALRGSLSKLTKATWLRGNSFLLTTGGH